MVDRNSSDDTPGQFGPFQGIDQSHYVVCPAGCLPVVELSSSHGYKITLFAVLWKSSFPEERLGFPRAAIHGNVFPLNPGLPVAIFTHMEMRSTKVQRKTKETDIDVRLDLDGEGTYQIRTGIPFLNHMIELFAKHALFNLRLKAKGDLAVDYHHTVEDVGLALGEALDKSLGDRKGIVRYGWALVPMDESLTRVALDLGGRPYLVYEVLMGKKKIRDFDLGLIEEFFRAFTIQGRMNLHIKLMYGREPHHAYESVFKGVAKAMSMACAKDSRVKGVPSSKGRI